MSYSNVRSSLAKGRSQRIAALMGESGGSWFTGLWSSVDEMLKAFDSDSENQTVASGYADAPGLARAAAHMKLDYVCSARREVRKQYVSGDGDICTDVTPLRHGIMSVHGAGMFDDLMDTVVKNAERQSSGGAA